MAVLHFLRSHLYLTVILVALAAVAFWMLSKNRRARQRFQEMAQIKRRDEALTEALRNPQAKTENGVAEGPMEISWDDKAVRKSTGKGRPLMVELVELSTYSRRRYVYRMDRPVRIGSGDGNQMELPREGVAESHCEIFLLNGRACIRSLSGAKTLLKRKKELALISSEGAYLKNGDQIQLGSAEIQFRMFRA